MEIVVSNTSMQCHRLRKDCRQTVRVRKPKALSKTAQLEQKLDGLMLMLQSKTDQTTSSPAPSYPSAS
ncbi:hypothetical protein HDV63DRAFT_362811 [Trichoderma sp. SZMC 28014]